MNATRMRKIGLVVIALAAIGGCASNGSKPPAGQGGTGGSGGSDASAGSAGSGALAGSGGLGGSNVSSVRAGSGGGGTAGDGGAAGGATTVPPTQTDASVTADAVVDDGGPADGATTDSARTSTFSFFVTSTGTGTMGGNLGGLKGADMKCQTLAAAVGAGDRTWHAYLSLSATNGQPAVNARDRIGKGPWFNVKGAKIADDLDKLHEVGGVMNGIGPDTSLDEKGSVVPNIVNKITPNQHDMLTGTALDGTALPATPDRTCAGWTSNASSGVTAEVGHIDRTGNVKTPAENYPWNASHYTPGCAADQFLQVGGTGRWYCFAID